MWFEFEEFYIRVWTKKYAGIFLKITQVTISCVLMIFFNKIFVEIINVDLFVEVIRFA
jgi:hypothetical protein